MTRNITMRHELKYICSDRQVDEYKKLLSSFLNTDSHQRDEGYNIKSIYFDTANSRMLNETLSGIESRSKYRIRIYNNSNDFIHLEKKISINNLKRKESMRLSNDQFYDILCNKYDLKYKLLNEMYVINRTELLEPKIIVQYNRYALVNEFCNIRITFDREISYSNSVYDLFNENLITIPILPHGKNILEIKYDGMLPGYISKLLKSENLQQLAFSKYALCRNASDNNGRMEGTYEY